VNTRENFAKEFLNNKKKQKKIGERRVCFEKVKKDGGPW
jgi:hypothetical protein